MSLKLTYFPLPGRAYVARVCFAIGGIEFEDERIPGEEFGKRKAAGELPLGSLPCLTLPNGRMIVESGAIARYAAKRAGLYPADAEKQLLCDEAVEICSSVMSKTPYDKDPEEKKKNREAFAEGLLKKFFGLLNQRIGESDGPFILGSEFCMADIAVYSLVKMLHSGFIDHIPTDYDAQFSGIVTMMEALEGNARFAPHKL